MAACQPSFQVHSGEALAKKEQASISMSSDASGGVQCRPGSGGNGALPPPPTYTHTHFSAGISASW